MDTNLLIVVAVLGGLLLITALLRRSWGGGAAPALPIASVAEVADPERNPWLVRIEQPMVRRAAEQAVRKGGSSARRIMRSGDQLYFSFDYIADVEERRQAVDLMRRMQSGADCDLKAALRLIRDMFKD